MRRLVQIFLLTAVFGGIYYALRALPASSCSFLHYDQTVVSTDGLEFCGSSASIFIDVKHLPFPVSINLKGDRPLAMGHTTHYSFTITQDDGKVLRPSEFAVTHTRKLHLMLVDPSLEDYQHIHPEPNPDDSGQWTFDFTPRRAGAYQLFAEFVPAVSLRQVVASARLEVPGPPSTGLNRGATPFTLDGYTFTLTLPDGPLLTGVDEPLHLQVQRADGGPVKLEPVMGALAHVVVFDAARDGYAHLHPIQTGAETDPHAPKLAFSFDTAKPGRYRFWAQVKLDGQEKFAPFDLQFQ